MNNLQEIFDAQLKVAFVEGNREVSNKNVKAKVASFKEFGGNLAPLVYVAGERIIGEGLKLIDPESRKPIPNEDADKYICIIEGQNRYKAALEANIDKKNIYVWKCPVQGKIVRIIAAMNLETCVWNEKDVQAGLHQLHKGNEFVEAVHFFTEKNFSCSTISKFLFFRSNQASKAKLFQMLKATKDENIKPSEGFDKERAMAIYDAASKHFDDKFLSKRYFIDAVIAVAEDEGKKNYQKIVKAIDLMEEAQVEQIKEVGANEKYETIKEILQEQVKQL